MANLPQAPVANVAQSSGWLWATRAAAAASVLGLWLVIALPLWQDPRSSMAFLLILGTPVWGAYFWVLYRLRRSSVEKGAKEARVVGAVALALVFLPLALSVATPGRYNVALHASLAFFVLTQVALVVSAWKVCRQLQAPPQPSITGDPRWIRATLAIVLACLLVVGGMVVVLTVRWYASEGVFALALLLLLVPFGAPYAWSAWCLGRPARQEQGLSAGIGVGLFMLAMFAVLGFLSFHARPGLGFVAPVVGFGLLQFALVAVAAKSRYAMQPADSERQQLARYLLYAGLGAGILLLSLLQALAQAIAAD